MSIHNLLDINEYLELKESMKDIYLDKTKLIWNPNKSEKRWKERIKIRTGYTYETFYELIQKAINKHSNQICDIGDSCLIFKNSKFILVLNKEKSKIITIRDTEWEKPLNDTPCKRILSFESKEDEEFYIDVLLENRMDFDWGKYTLNENWDLIVETNCTCCVEVDL